MIRDAMYMNSIRLFRGKSAQALLCGIGTDIAGPLFFRLFFV